MTDDDIAALAALAGLTIASERLPAVRQELEALAAAARRLDAVALDDVADEPAPVFMAR